jgi:hypothetical protein
MSTKSREVIFGSRIRGAKIRAEGAREEAVKAVREPIAPRPRRVQSAWRDTAGQHSHRRRSRNASTVAGYGWLQVKCRRCETEASISLENVRRARDTPIWKLEAALKCRSCRTPRYSPPAHMIKLTETREISPYVWVRIRTRSAEKHLNYP